MTFFGAFLERRETHLKWMVLLQKCATKTRKIMQRASIAQVWMGPKGAVLSTRRFVFLSIQLWFLHSMALSGRVGDLTFLCCGDMTLMGLPVSGQWKEKQRMSVTLLSPSISKPLVSTCSTTGWLPIGMSVVSTWELNHNWLGPLVLLRAFSVCTGDCKKVIPGQIQVLIKKMPLLIY